MSCRYFFVIRAGVIVFAVSKGTVAPHIAAFFFCLIAFFINFPQVESHHPRHVFAVISAWNIKNIILVYSDMADRSAGHFGIADNTHELRFSAVEEVITEKVGNSARIGIAAFPHYDVPEDII